MEARRWHSVGHAVSRPIVWNYFFLCVCFPVCLWQQINKRASLASEMHPCGHWSTLRSAVGQQSLSAVNRSCLVVFPIAFRKCTALMFSLTGVAVVAQSFDFTLAPAARLIDLSRMCVHGRLTFSPLCVWGRMSCDLYGPLASRSLDEIMCTVRVLELKSHWFIRYVVTSKLADPLIG